MAFRKRRTMSVEGYSSLSAKVMRAHQTDTSRTPPTSSVLQPNGQHLEPPKPQTRQSRSKSVTFKEPVQTAESLPPLHRAAHLGDLDALEIALNGEDVDQVSKNGNTPLVEAFEQGHLDVMKYLLEKRAHIDRPTNGETVLLRAAKRGFAETVQLLLDNFANFNTSNSDGMTPLIYASIGGHTGVVSALLQHGASVNLSNNKRSSSLQYASKAGHLEIVKLLVEHSARVNQIDMDYNTAYSLAAGNKHEDVVEFLLKNGADKTTHLEAKIKSPLAFTSRPRHRRARTQPLLGREIGLELVDTKSSSRSLEQKTDQPAAKPNIQRARTRHRRARTTTDFMVEKELQFWKDLREKQQREASLRDLFKTLNIPQKYLNCFEVKGLGVDELKDLTPSECQSLIPDIVPRSILLQYIFTVLKNPKKETDKKDVPLKSDDNL